MASSKLIFLCIALAVLSTTVSAGLFDPLNNVLDPLNKMFEPVNKMLKPVHKMFDPLHKILGQVVPNGDDSPKNSEKPNDTKGDDSGKTHAALKNGGLDSA